MSPPPWQGAPYRHRLIGELNLVSLDGETLTDLDRQLANGYLDAACECRWGSKAPSMKVA